MREASKILVIVSMLFLFGCKDNDAITDESEIRERYFDLEEVGWKSHEHRQELDNINYNAAEVPVAYYILNKLGNKDLLAVDSIEKANKRERIIEFNFSEDGKKDLLEEVFTGMGHEEAVKYMSFSIDKDFYVVTSKKDTITCSGAVFESSFKVTPACKLLLFFGDIDPNEKIQLVYNDRLFGKGTLKFKLEEPIIRAEL